MTADTKELDPVRRLLKHAGREELEAYCLFQMAIIAGEGESQEYRDKLAKAITPKETLLATRVAVRIMELREQVEGK